MNKERRRIRVRMERPFETVGQGERAEFLDDLARLSGCPADKFENVVFRRGCVVFEATFDGEAVLRILELFERRQQEEPVPDITALRQWMDKHRVTDVSSIETLRLTIRSTKKSPDRKLVFIHGWRGGSDSFGVLPKFLSDRFECESLIYHYPTGFWQKSPSLEFVVRNLDNWIRNRVGEQLGREGLRLGLVSHSMGGLIARKLLVTQDWRDKPLDVLVRHVALIASPHHGSALAALGKHVPLVRHVQLAELDSNSPFLLDLNDRWQHWVRQRVPGNCTVRCVYGTADAVVSANNARGLDNEAVPILNAGHIDIVKPATETDEIVLTIARFLRESSF